MLPPVLLGLTAVAGLTDAVAFLALGHVFTANMTGNVVFLALAVAGTSGLSAARCGAALAAFVAGAVIGGRLATRLSSGLRHRWTGVAFGAEAGLFLAAMAVAVYYGAGLANAPAGVYAVIVLTGLAMGIRNATVRKLAVPDLTTTVLTLTITGLIADSTLAGGRNPASARRIASVAAMFAGATLGAYLLRYQIALTLAVCALISGVCAVAAYVGIQRSVAIASP